MEPLVDQPSHYWATAGAGLGWRRALRFAGPGCLLRFTSHASDAAVSRPGFPPPQPLVDEPRIRCLLRPDEVAERELGLPRRRTVHEVPQTTRGAFDVCTRPARYATATSGSSSLGMNTPHRHASARPAADRLVDELGRKPG